jgi:uncharacterized OsmC-like protein
MDPTLEVTMKFSASLKNNSSDHQVRLKVGEREQTLPIAPKPAGGSSVTGGELLFLALATCFCNDIYREGAKRGITVNHVEVEVEGDFEAERQPATNIVYRVKVDANASEEELQELIQYVDSIAEIQNTLRLGTPVKLQI